MESGIICIAVVVWHISYDSETEDWKVLGHNHAAVCIRVFHENTFEKKKMAEPTIHQPGGLV